MTAEPRRALPVDDAAAYVGAKSTKQFLREVEKGLWPAPIPVNSRPRRWDVKALDKALDQMSGLRDRSADADDDGTNPWDEVEDGQD